MADSSTDIRSGQISLDGQRFVGVTFRTAQLVFGGGTPPVFEGCSFDQTTFEFVGAANMTLHFLKAMAPADTNMREVVYGLIPELRD